MYVLRIMLVIMLWLAIIGLLFFPSFMVEKQISLNFLFISAIFFLLDDSKRKESR